MMNERVSVCLATYRGEKYLAEQINSILVQLRDGDELLISDDGSDDDTLQILRSYCSKVRMVGTSRVGGVVQNFERVLREARNPIVVLSDQDDVWLPSRLDRIKEALHSVDCVMLDGQVVDSELRQLGSRVFQLVPQRNGVIANLYKNSFVGCCMAFRKELLDLALPFPRHLPWHDWYLGLLAITYFRFSRADFQGIQFRRHNSNASNTGRKTTDHLQVIAMRRVWIIYALLVASLRRFRQQLKLNRSS